MGLPDGYTILTVQRIVLLGLFVAGLVFPGCGLVIDAAQQVWPHTADQADSICRQGRLQVGIAYEPFRPFVFPAIFTDEGLRVTGMDVEMVKEITAALSKRCGDRLITPVLHLVRFRDLFVELNEGKLDLFVSAVAANVPSPTRAGLAYSTPYFYDAGLTLIVRRPEVAEMVRARLRRQGKQPPGPDEIKEAMEGLAVAVQEGRVAQYFAEVNLATAKLVLCDSLPAAFESENPVIDAILGAQPVLEFMVKRVRKDWQPLTLDTGEPLLFTRLHYAVVMAEENYRLRWVVNDLLFQLSESGRLAEMRRRWLEEDYAYPRRAAKEGLPFAVENMPQHYDQGQCRWTSAK